MKTEACGPVKSPQTVTSDNNLLSSKTHNFTDSFEIFSPIHCEFCGGRITNHDLSEAPYADGKYLCTACREEYMDLHHPDPFQVMMTKHQAQLEEVTA